MRTRVLTAIFASALLISPSFAEDTGALTPGKPAGVRKAEIFTGTVWGIAFLAAIGIGAGLIVANEGDQKTTNNAPVSTSTTTP